MGKKKSGAKAGGSANERESFQMDDDQSWEVVHTDGGGKAKESLTAKMAAMQMQRDHSDSDVEMTTEEQTKSKPKQQKQQPKQMQTQTKQQQQQQAKQQQNKAPRKPSPARVEEFSDSDDEDDAAAQTVQQRKKRVVTLPPKAGATGASAAGSSSSGGAPMTALQRKVMQKSNKNSNKGLGNKGKQAVPAGDGELINEEEEGGGHISGLSDDDDDSEEGESSGAESAGSDDDVIWETPQQRRAKREAAAAAAAHAAANPSKGWSLSTMLRWLAVLALVGCLIWIRLQDASLLHGLDPDDIDMTSQPPSESSDLYAVLGLDRGADLRAVKAQYRKLVLVTHPDKNPGCTDCIARFQQVQKAYDVLSNKDKRAIYDSIELQYDLLKSEAVELTAQNFESEVLHKDDVWVIQLYTDWHKSAIRFSQAWEEAIQRYGSLVRFGRVHAQRERDLARTMPAKFNVIPAVVIYANGRFQTSKTFLESSRHSLPKLARFIADAFPNSVESVAHTPAEIRGFMRRTAASKDTSDQATMLFFPDFAKQAEQARKQQQPQSSRGGSQQQRFQQQMLQTNTQSINEPSLSMKSIARKYQYSFLFGQVQQIAEPGQWKNWIKDVSSAFKLTPPVRLPAILYQENADSSPKWFSTGTGQLTKETLMRHTDALHRRMVPWFNSHSYARHCTDSSSSRPAACVLALACRPLKIGDLEFNSFASGALAMLKLQAFKSANIQFGKVDVARHGDMAPLCQALPERARNSAEMGIVVVTERGTEMSFYGSGDHPKQSFDAWLQHVLKKDGSVPSFPAPYLPAVHIPDDMLAVQLPHLGLVLLPLKWLYGGVILVSLWFLAPIISRHFGSFLYIIFALSIIVPGYELVKDVYDKYVAAA